MDNNQILTWLKARRNGAHTQWVSLPRLIRELEALIKLEPNNFKTLGSIVIPKGTPRGTELEITYNPDNKKLELL